MADAAALQVCLAKIISIIENEASLLGGLGDELDELKRELQSMRAFLVDADRKRFPRNEGERRWVEDVTDMAYQVEDLIDEFAYYMNRPHGNGRFTRFLHKTIHFPKDLCMRHRIATKLQKIISMIKAIPERNERYRVHEEHNEEGTSYLDDHHNTIRNLRESSLPARDDELVGIDGDKEKLMRWLTNADQPQRIVISVVGMGGIGKTTLVANAYNSQQVRQHFDCFAWISVSQTFQTEDLLRRMVKDVCQATKEMIPPDLNTMNYPELVKKLVHHLEQKKYIVVLDDVWDQNLWTQIERSLPDGKHGSRILITTRNTDIATFNFGVGSHVHNIQALRKEEAWVLFCKKALPNNPNSTCPPEQEALALELLKKCGGLPLAIVTLGGVMSSKKSVAEWIDVRNSLDWQLTNNQKLDAVKRILWLSYNDLPYRLKQCFLYCSLFPEDYAFNRERLIRLWIAEGFVEEVKAVTPEVVAERYLMELINRSMIQVASRDYYGRLTCKMHDFLREVALTASEKGKFCVVHDGSKALEGCEGRRLSLQASEKEISSFKGMSQLRSFFLFSRGISHTFLPSKFKLLRVLDLEDGRIVKLPDELVNLFNLRYLNLRRSMVKELPKAIGRLRNLQTLDITDSKVEVLPVGILKLQKLRHLFMYRSNNDSSDGFNFEVFYGTPAPSNIWKLKNLQVLDSIAAEGDLVKGLKNMTQLTRIGITKVRREDDKELCDSIQKMNLLHYLFVMSKDDEEPLRMDALRTAPRYLKKLFLFGKLERMPHWFESLQNLEVLSLYWSRLEEDPLPYIQELPNLGRLTLSNAWQGERLCFVTGFRKLKYLGMRSLPQLCEIIIIDKGVMPALNIVDVKYCPELKSIEGLEHLINLEELYVPSHMDLHKFKQLFVDVIIKNS